MRGFFLQALCAGALVFPALAYCGRAAAQEPQRAVNFSAVREGAFIKVSASVELPVDPALAWAVLTDYDHYAGFISGLSESKVLDRNPDGVVIEQKGELGVMFFKQSVHTRMLVTELPPASVVSRGIDGSFKDLTGRYDLQPAGSAVRLVYSGSFVPDFFLPPLIGMAVVRYALEKNFSELAAEIVRRAGFRK
jgi:ribosome-associated toxin RatA of RatAB toxin-antitoxin module